METLKKLTPAETLIIRDLSNVTFKNLLKFTLLDLILKRVLVVKNDQLPEDDNSENQVAYKNIEKGPAFDSYHPKYHEEIYLIPFMQDPELSIQFKHLVKTGWEGARSKNHYVFRQVLKSREIVHTMKEGWFYRTFGYCKLTPEGLEMQRRLNTEMAYLEDKLPSLIENNPEEVKALIGQLHGNLLLVRGFDYNLLKQLDDVFDEELVSRQSAPDVDTAALWFFFLYDDFNTSFDSEYDSYGASSYDGGGGCSSDGGGDGGCSGCGGCGGCGG